MKVSKDQGMEPRVLWELRKERIVLVQIRVTEAGGMETFVAEEKVETQRVMAARAMEMMIVIKTQKVRRRETPGNRPRQATFRRGSGRRALLAHQKELRRRENIDTPRIVARNAVVPRT
jgi:hypothetical protein